MSSSFGIGLERLHRPGSYFELLALLPSRNVDPTQSMVGTEQEVKTNQTSNILRPFPLIGNIHFYYFPPIFS